MSFTRKFLRRQTAAGRRKFTRWVRLRERIATWKAGIEAEQLRRDKRAKKAEEHAEHCRGRK